MAADHQRILTLASASPQRRAILEEIGIPLLIRPQDVDESLSGASIEEEVLRIAAKKADACLLQGGHSRWVLGVDTAVGLDHHILGKPAGAVEAREVISSLQGRRHLVASGAVLIDTEHERRRSELVVTEVEFQPMSPAEIDWYVASGEWRGAAGGYRIQNRAALFIRSIAGSYHNVVGLPISTIYGMLTAFNYPFEN